VLRVVVTLVLGAALVVGAGPPARAQEEATLTLEEALAEALARNPALVVERNTVGIAAGTLRQARIYPFNPELEAEGGAGRAKGIEEDERRGTNVQGVGLSQTIWLRGQRGIRIRSAQAGLRRAEAIVRDAERTVIGDVPRAFADLLVAQERVALAREVVALATEVADVARKQFEAGAVPELDAFRAEVELDKARNRLVAEERNRRTAERELALLLGRPAELTLRAAAPVLLPIPPGDVAALQQAAVGQRPDLAAAREAVRTAAAELDLVRAERFFPELRVGVKYEESREFDSTGRAGLLTLSVPLPLINRLQGDIDRAAAELRQQEAAVDFVRRRIEKEVATALQQVVASRQVVDAYQDRILRDQERNFRLLREGYDLGEFKITDVLVGQREFIDAREAYLEAVSALNGAVSDLYRALGTRP